MSRGAPDCIPGLSTPRGIIKSTYVTNTYNRYTKLLPLFKLCRMISLQQKLPRKYVRHLQEANSILNNDCLSVDFIHRSGECLDDFSIKEGLLGALFRKMVMLNNKLHLAIPVPWAGATPSPLPFMMSLAL